MKLIKQHEDLMGFKFTDDQKHDLVKCIQTSTEDRHKRYVCAAPVVVDLRIAESVNDQMRFGFIGGVDFAAMQLIYSNKKIFKDLFKFSNQTIIHLQQ